MSNRNGQVGALGLLGWSRLDPDRRAKASVPLIRTASDEAGLKVRSLEPDLTAVACYDICPQEAQITP